MLSKLIVIRHDPKKQLLQRKALKKQSKQEINASACSRATFDKNEVTHKHDTNTQKQQKLYILNLEMKPSLTTQT